MLTQFNVWMICLPFSLLSQVSPQPLLQFAVKKSRWRFQTEFSWQVLLQDQLDRLCAFARRNLGQEQINFFAFFSNILNFRISSELHDRVQDFCTIVAVAGNRRKYRNWEEEDDDDSNSSLCYDDGGFELTKLHSNIIGQLLSTMKKFPEFIVFGIVELLFTR